MYKMKEALAPPARCMACPIRKMALFQPLARSEVKSAQRYKSENRMLAAGSDIYRQGDACTEIYTLYDGWAFLYMDIPPDKRQILRFLLPGDLLGFHGDLEGCKHPHSAQGVSGVSLCVFPSSRLLKMFRRHPKLGIRVTWMTAQDNALAHEHLASLGRRRAQDKIAHLLLELFYRVRMRLPESDPQNTIDFPLTQELIGDAVGLTSIHVNRTIMALRRSGLVEIKARKLTIPDPEAMSNLTGFSRRISPPRHII